MKETIDSDDGHFSDGFFSFLFFCASVAETQIKKLKDCSSRRRFQKKAGIVVADSLLGTEFLSPGLRAKQWNSVDTTNNDPRQCGDGWSKMIPIQRNRYQLVREPANSSLSSSVTVQHANCP